MKAMYLWSLLVFVLPFSQPISARSTQAALVPIHFGTQDTIKEIQPVAGTDYILCHKHHIYYFVAGLYLKDDGYVLREKFNYDKYRLLTNPTADKYLPLTPEKIKELQQAGILPSPLPKYSISTGEYIEGYSLWLCLSVAIALLLLRLLIRRMWDRYTAPDP